MKITFCFNGWLTVDSEDITAVNLKNEKQDLSKLTAAELVKALEGGGDLYLKLADCLEGSEDSTVDMFDFEVQDA